VAQVYAAVRREIAPLVADRPMGEEIERVMAGIRAGRFDPAATP